MSLCPSRSRSGLREALERDFADIRDVLHATTLLKRHSRDTLELVSGYGEIWSAQILTAHLAERHVSADWLNARDVLIVEPRVAAPSVAWADVASAHRRVESVESRAVVDAGRHRVCRVDVRRRGNHARTEWKRFQCVDIRGAPRCGRDPDLDRRRRRDERESTPGARSRDARCTVVQRSDGARVLRREGDPSEHDGAGGRPRTSDHHPQHVQARASGDAHRGERRVGVRREGSRDDRGNRAAESRRDWSHRRSWDGAASVRRAARRRHLRDHDLARQLRALDLFRRSGRACGSSAGARSSKHFSPNAITDRFKPWTWHPAAAFSRSSATGWPGSPASRRSSSAR